MHRFPLLIAVLVLANAAVFAQAPVPYRVDNFDFANGVRVETPPAATLNKRRPRKLISNTSLSYNRTALSELAKNGIGNSLEGFTTGNAEVDSYIVESGRRHSVDPLLLYSIMHQESSFKRRALSYKGASGLMQLMPPTARRFGVTNIWDAKQNIEGGTRYMRFLLDYFEGDVELALAGYNAGEGAVVKYGYRVPPYAETREYVRRIGSRYSLIRDPMAARLANPVTREQLASAQQADSKPLYVYERTVSAIRLPDGRLQLISQ
jgi:soluble lytic murein transglycosylase-like protein